MQLVILVLVMMCCTLSAWAQEAATTELRVGTFNIRNSHIKDGPTGWVARKPLVVGIIEKANPDLIGMQEVLPDQQADLDQSLKGYASVATFRDDGKAKGEAASIFYRKDRFDRLDSGSFWLSQTPEVAGSFGWDAACTRICTWVRLRDRKADRTIVFANTHFDHVGQTARMESAKLIASRLAAFKNDALILTGDFNAVETEPAYATLIASAKERGIDLTDTYRSVHATRRDDEASFHDFKGDTHGLRIDWIFCSPQFVSKESVIDRTKSTDGIYASDHYPVWATLQYAK